MLAKADSHDNKKIIVAEIGNCTLICKKAKKKTFDKNARQDERKNKKTEKSKD